MNRNTTDNNPNNLKISKRVKKVYIIMRHGERADLAYTGDSKVKISNEDPELTARGIRQAKAAGEKIINFLNSKFQKLQLNFTMISSPMTRTIMTAISVLEGIGHPKIPIYIELGICEWLKEEWFGNKQLKDFIALYSNPVNSFFNDQTKNFNLFNNSYTQCPLTPEIFEQHFNRSLKSFDIIKKNYPKKENFCNSDEKSNENVEIIFIITHGYVVNTICLNLNYELLCLEYCETVIFGEYDDEKYEILMDQFNTEDTI